MKAYIYWAALLCECCAERQRREIERESGSSQQLLETGTDSEGYPQGPYPDGGGEADCPQHCDQCGVFLDNPLTGDGAEYVSDCFTEYMRTGRGNADVLREWKEAYPDSWSAVADFMEEQAGVSDLRRIRFEILTD